MRSVAARSGFVLSLGAVLGLVACGGAGVKKEGSPYTVGEVMSRFREMTGDDLRMEGKVLDLRRVGGVRSVSLSVAKSLRKKYGEFRYVVVLGNPATLEGQLLDPSQREGKPAADRVYWSKGYDELSADTRPYWSAEKYGATSRSIWFPPSRQEGVDEVFPEARIGAPANLRDQG